MYKLSIKIFYLLLVLALTNVALLSQVKVEQLSHNRLKITYTPEISGYDTVDVSGNKFIKPKIKDAIPIHQTVGKAEELMYRYILEVGQSQSFKIEDNYKMSYKSLDYPLVPVPNLLNDSLTPLYSIDKYYEINQSKIEQVNLKYAGVARGKHLAYLDIPVAFQVTFNSTTILKNIELIVDLGFDFNVNQATKTLENQVQNNGVDIAAGNYGKLKINKEGIYRVTSSQLSSAGINIPASMVNTIKIYGRSGEMLSETPDSHHQNDIAEQPIIVRQNGNNFEIIFYASYVEGFNNRYPQPQHYINSYTKDNSYLIVWGGRNGIRANAKQIQSDATPAPSTYTHRIMFKESITNALPAGAGRKFLGRSFFNQSFVNTLHNLDRSGEITYRLGFGQRSRESGYFNVFENNKVLMSNIFMPSLSGGYDGMSLARREVKFSASEIASDNRSVLRLEHKNASPAATGYFDYYEIHYPRSFMAINNELCFDYSNASSINSRFTIGGFTGEVFGFDISDRSNPILLKNEANDMDKFIFTDSISNKISRYYLSSTLHTPTIETAIYSDLRTRAADHDMIIVTHSSLIASAQKFKEYREKQSGLKIFIATTEEIYNEFAGGRTDVAALRNFVGHAYDNSNQKPFYLLLWGDGHWDYKNIQSVSVSLVPPYVSSDENDSMVSELSTTSTDDFFARVDGNDRIPDLSVGRVTVENNTMGEQYVAKLDHYENNSDHGSWRHSITLIADDGPTTEGNDGAMHTDQTETLWRDYLHPYTYARKMYLVDYPTQILPRARRKPQLRADFISNINNNGAIILSWIGHGNPRVWAHEEVFDKETMMKDFNNFNKLFFLSAATCDFGRFDATDYRSGAEEMVMSRNSGAIAAFATTRIVLSGPNSAITNAYFSNLSNRPTGTSKFSTIGEAMYRTKLLRSSENDEKFFILGDPSLRLLLPEQNVIIDKIESPVASFHKDTIFLKGLEEVKVTGRVIYNDNNQLVDNFNGFVTLTMHDGDDHSTLVDFNREFRIQRFGGLLNKSSFKVENGHFTANFVLPQDISFSPNKGRLYAYARDEENKQYAMGLDRSFVVQGISSSGVIDNTPPEINIYLDSRRFKEGDIVRSEPLVILDLFDDIGINSTGTGIGKKIEIWLDNSPNSIDFTPFYEASLTDPRFGSAARSLQGLSPGYHHIRARAWDLFNNFSEVESFFYVGKPNSAEAFESMAYPNPFENEIKIGFKHSFNPGYTATLQIFDMTGRLVYNTKFDGNTANYTEISWNGHDSNGLRLPQGAYSYTVSLTNALGNNSTTRGLIVKISQ